MAELLKDKIAEIQEKASKAAEMSGRRAEDITVLAATKTVSPDIINEAVAMGIINIGENRVQELTQKYDSVSKDATWHFIGHLQTNKVKYIIDKVKLIHSVESERLMDEIDQRAEKLGICARVLIEVNQAGEASKFGVNPSDVLRMIENNEKRKNVKIHGLMTVGPNSSEKSIIRANFSNLYKLFLDIGQKKYDNSSMDYLSMGMSNDYEEAIMEGSNIVRLGSKIFGNRK